MKFLKLLVLLLIIVQFPFIYSVCQSRQLDRYLANLPRETVTEVPYRDLRGTVHVHTAAGSHSLGTYQEVAEAARRAGYDYLFITEHPKEQPLFEQLIDPGLVMIYGIEEERHDSGRTLRSIESEVRILAYLEGRSVPDDVTGLEVFNMFESAKESQNMYAWINWIYHQFTYEELFFFHILNMDSDLLRVWDRSTARRHLAGFAGNDAHQNLGLLVQTSAGDRLFQIQVDPYLTSFQFLTNHIFVPPEAEISEELVLNALRDGSSYIAFERIADPTGFSFHALAQGEVFPMGADVPVGSQLVLQAPVPSLFKLILGGSVLAELEGTRFVYEAEESGAYRLEVYPLGPPALLEDQPWILSNPIYVN